MDDRTTETLETPAKTNRIDHSKTYVCRAGCDFETTWLAALGASQTRAPRVAVKEGCRHSRQEGGERSSGRQAQDARVPIGKFGRLLSEIREQQDELLQALKKAYLLVLADRDERTREAGRVKADLNAIYEVLERNRKDREQRISVLIR
jgi:hypothetical protein